MTTALPSTATTTRTTPAPVGTAGEPRPLALVGVVAGVAAGLAATAVAVAAKAAGVPLEAGPASADTGTAIPLYGFFTGTLFFTAIGIALAYALARFAKQPARTWVIATVALTVLSMAGPLTTQHATLATRLVLGLTHLPAAAIVITAVARNLAERPARRGSIG